MPDLFTIGNSEARAVISAMGAELTSFFDIANNRELIRKPDGIWTSQAPVLFPFIGRLKTGAYTCDGSRYAMDIHGFAKNMTFGAVQTSPESLSFTLTSGGDTLAMYPFEFIFTVKFTLAGRVLVKEHIITNNSAGTMYYEVGGHEGFSLRHFPGDTFNDYYLLFPGKDRLDSFTFDENIMMTDNMKTVETDRGRLDLRMDLFKGDALVFGRNAGGLVSICSKTRGELITVSCKDFDYLGIWTSYKAQDADYICVEPWSSLPDHAGIGTELAGKKGVLSLRLNETQRYSYSITI